MSLLATGSGGVLYPPRSMNNMLFDQEAIRSLCLYADDLWLKTMQYIAGTPVVLAQSSASLSLIKGTQNSALFEKNLVGGDNDLVLQAINKHFANSYPTAWKEVDAK